MRPMILALSLGAALAGLQTASARQAESAEPVEPAARALSTIVGVWEGSGWRREPSGELSTFDIFETVIAGSGGHALILRGEGFSPEGAGRGGDPTHDATAIIYPGQDGHRIRTVIDTGQSQDRPITLTEEGFRWSIDLGSGGEVRYEATIIDGVWRETGDFCPPQQACAPFMEMELTRAD